jgi:hypothetical protein
MADPNRLGQTERDEKVITVVGHLLKAKRNAKPAPSVPMNIDTDDMEILFEQRDKIVEALSPE